MKLHYFVKQTANGRFQAQESQASYGGEHDHPAEFEGEEGALRVKSYATAEEAGRAALAAANEARCSPDGQCWVITANPLQVARPFPRG